MPWFSVGPETAMLTPILGEMPKTCQFSAGYLALKLNLKAELSALSILAEPTARGATSGMGENFGTGCQRGMKPGGGCE